MRRRPKVCCIALLGVWNWRGTNDKGGKTALADWEAIALNDREVFICFDPDVTRKREVWQALDRLRAFLERRSAHVTVLYLPAGADGQKVGLDDYLAAGNGEGELLALVNASRNGAGAVRVEGDGALELPIINRHNKRRRDLVTEGVGALDALNCRDPKVFQRSGALARIKWIDGAAEIEMLTTDSLGLLLDQAANWIDADGTKYRKIDPPDHVVRAILTLPRYPFPNLRGIAQAPFFAGDGRPIAAAGYDPASCIFLDPTGLAALDAVPEQPPAEYVRMAVEYLRGELLVDFPYATAADRANAIGLLLAPFVRPMIVGPVPFHVIDSPQAGTGKSLLASVIHIVATGRNAPTGIERFDPSEAGKAITAILLEAPPIILLDNITRHLMSGPFAAVLTADVWKDRVLGQSKMVTVENRAVWIATANNLTLSSELRRRAIEIRLDAKLERPDERSGFRHPDLKAWTRANRPALVHACLVIIQNWLALGRPAAPMKPLGSFEDWSRIVGGILAAAQIEGFLSNAESFRERADPDAKNWRRFIDEWGAAHGVSPIVSEILMPIAAGFLPDVLGTGTEHSQRIRLGKALTKRAGQMFGQWCIETAECRDDEGRARNGFRLTRAPA